MPDWETYCEDIDKRETKRPKCSCCGSPIWSEDAYELEGELFCADCANEWLESKKVYLDE